MSEKRHGLHAFFFDHVLAKLLSLALAIVTVYLIEQEISDEVDWVEQSRRVRVVIEGQDGEMKAGEPRVVLRPGPGVAVLRFEPATVKLRVRGPANKQAKFAVVANRVREYTRIYGELEEFLKKLKVPVVTHLRDSMNYVRCAERGIGIHEMAPYATTVDREQWKPLLRVTTAARLRS